VEGTEHDTSTDWSNRIHHDVEVDHDSVSWKLNPTRNELHRLRAYYYANVEMIDREVGEILDALEKRGRMDDTIIIFTSDHGDCLGDHGLSQKWAPYDEVTRVPPIKAGLLTVLMEWHIDSAVQTRDARKRVVAPMALA
jgi:arylsulfatase A-like enzyme